MANNPAGRVFFPQPTSSPGKPALVAYPGSDSDESSLSDAPEVHAQSLDSDTLELLADSQAETAKVAAAEQLLALAMDRPAVVDSLEKAIGESSHRYDDAQQQDTNMDDNDETISDINNETHDIEFETALVDGEEQAKGSDNTPRCWGDIKYPRVGTCDHEFRIKNPGERYRKVVSDFFGRNKKATSSVPPDCYPTICRTCYQRLAYRLGSMNKDEPEKDAAAVAKLRCDAIIAALEKMKEKTFVDRHGYEWPWWCGLELQLTNDGQALLEKPEELEADIEKKNAEVAKQKAAKAQSPKGKPYKRLHKRVKPEYLPDWLQKLCQANTGDEVIAQAGTSTIGDRNGVRYSFDELVLIIKAIKTFCHESRCAFPTIEAIPVPIGLLDEQILRDMRKQRAAANNMRTKTKRDAAEKDRQSRDQPSNSLRKTRATAAREAANDASAVAIAAEQAVDQAQDDASLSAGTIPGKRSKSDPNSGKAGKVKLTIKDGKLQKIEKSTEGVDTQEVVDPEDDDEISPETLSEKDNSEDEDYEEGRPAKRRRSATKPKTPKKPIPGGKGSYKDWIKKKYGDNPPPPSQSAAEVRQRMAQARRDGYATYVKPLYPAPSSF